MNHHSYPQFLQQIDIIPPEDKGVGSGRGTFKRDFKLSGAFAGKFGGVFTVGLPAAFGQQDGILTESK